MSSKTILYVDHNLTRVEQFCIRVKLDFKVETAFNGWDGLGATLMYNHDLVVFNLSVPILSGLEAIRLIRSEESLLELPFLGFTIPRDPVMEAACMGAGCTQIVEDPLSESLPIQLRDIFKPNHHTPLLELISL